jgi:hypothetical protein
MEEHKVVLIAVGAVGLVQQFYNDLDSIQILEAGSAPPGLTDLLPGADISAEKWELTNDWLQTVGSWSGERTPHFRVSKAFIAAHPTPAVWASTFLLLPDDPFGLFLPQAEEGRIVVGHFNGKPVRKRL